MSPSDRKQKLEKMLESEPNDSFLRYGLAMECMTAADHAGAVEQFAVLLRLTPDYVPAYFQYGRALIQLGRDDEAKQVLRAGFDVAMRAGSSHAAEEIQGLLASLDE